MNDPNLPIAAEPPDAVDGFFATDGFEAAPAEYVATLSGMSEGFRFAEREAIYDHLTARGMVLNRSRFRRFLELHRLYESARRFPLRSPWALTLPGQAPPRGWP